MGAHTNIRYYLIQTNDIIKPFEFNAKEFPNVEIIDLRVNDILIYLFFIRIYREIIHNQNNDIYVLKNFHNNHFYI